MAGLPTGTVTFLFTDIEGFPRLHPRVGDGSADALAEYQALLRAAIRERSGQEVHLLEDTCLATFGRPEDAVAAAVAAQQALAAHPWRDGAAIRARMGIHTAEPVLATGGYVGMEPRRVAQLCAAGHGGQVLLSQTTHDLVQRDLPAGVRLKDLGEHRLKDLQRSEKIFQVLHPDLPGEFPPLRTLDTLSNNLPVQVTSFIGREREISEITRLLSGTRLLTLTGAGGAGKTRLAIHAAAEMLEASADGVWLVELAPLLDPSLVPYAVASTLGAREEQGRTVMESLVDALRPRSLLLVLDNCEHLLAACAHLADTLRRSCLAVRIMATSREPLGLAGEMVYRVPSLSLPSQAQPRFSDLMQCEAVRLFVERAVFVHPEFTVTEMTAPAVARVCRRLDGIPLAIELAAARTKILSAEQIAARLDDRFRLLTGGTRSSLPRHQTLRAAIEWSHDLLSQPERMLLRRVAVFAGGFALDGAEAVCAGAGAGAEGVLDVLGRLVDKSLILAETSAGEARYRLQDTVRLYAQERLLESGEQAEFLARHRDWCIMFAERAALELQGPDQRAWLRRLETEHDNLRAALVFSLEGASGDAALRLVGALWWFWHVRGYLSEGRAWLAKAITGTEGAPPLARAKALYGAGVLAWRQGDFERARALCQESLILYRDLGHSLGIASAISILEQVARSQGDTARAMVLLEDGLALFRERGDTWGIATSLISLGNAVRSQGDHARARALLAESLDLFETLNDTSGRAASLHFLGLVARDHGDYSRAETLNRKSLSLSRQMGDQPRIAFSLHSLGLVARDRGELAQAQALFEESLALFRDLEDLWGITTALVSLGMVARLRGECQRAASLLQESLTLRRDLGDRWGIAECLECLAAAAAEHKHAERAALLLGAAKALRDTIGAPSPPTDLADCDRTATAARRRLGRKKFDAAWETGRRMEMEKAIEYALAPAPPPAALAAPDGRSPGRLPGPLTRREQEVTALIAQGRTNREIARALVVTEGTAANHVQHILNKLGLNSRAQIAAWAVEHGLHTPS
ncbi:MAG TPA: tetratricopeptide repeat protein [bacterium]|nr:tetratricopeptide repeat protein [bacterium]